MAVSLDTPIGYVFMLLIRGEVVAIRFVFLVFVEFASVALLRYSVCCLPLLVLHIRCTIYK